MSVVAPHRLPPLAVAPSGPVLRLLAVGRSTLQGDEGVSVVAPHRLPPLAVAPSGPILRPLAVGRSTLQGGEGVSVVAPHRLPPLAVAPSGPVLRLGARSRQLVVLARAQPTLGRPRAEPRLLEEAQFVGNRGI